VTRPAQRGDHVSIDVKAERAGEVVPELSVDDYLYEVGTSTLVPDLDDQLAGSKVGDILSFDTKVDDGAPVRFRVLVKDVKQKVLPEVTDEWAGEASEFETVAELREDIRRRLGVIKQVQSTMAFRDEALKALTELVDDDPPEALVKEGMERSFESLTRRLEARKTTLADHLASTGTSEEDLVAALRQEATFAVKADLALRALAAAEGLEATEADVDAELERFAERMEVDPGQLRRQLGQQDAIATVRSDVLKAKAFDWLLEHVEVVDEAGQPIERADLSPAPEAAHSHAQPEHVTEAEQAAEEGENRE
jgi:trigger factor